MLLPDLSLGRRSRQKYTQSSVTRRRILKTEQRRPHNLSQATVSGNLRGWFHCRSKLLLLSCEFNAKEKVQIQKGGRKNG
jgi:hypothetical protein